MVGRADAMAAFFWLSFLKQISPTIPYLLNPFPSPSTTTHHQKRRHYIPFITPYIQLTFLTPPTIHIQHLHNLPYRHCIVIASFLSNLLTQIKRALSSFKSSIDGINSPTTIAVCLHQLGSRTVASMVKIMASPYWAKMLNDRRYPSCPGVSRKVKGTLRSPWVLPKE